MTRRKNPDDRPSPDPEPTPEPSPDPEPTPEPTPEPEFPLPRAEGESPASSFESPLTDEAGNLLGPYEWGLERLKSLEAALADRDRTIARQAGELANAAENAELLEKSRDKVSRQKERWIEAKDEASAAKKAYEASLEGHLDLERDLLSGQQRLPFPPPDAPAATAPTAVSTPALPSVDAAAGDESWRPTPLGTLGIADELPHAILARLEDAGIVTVGDLADFVRPGPLGPSRRLVDVDGIGEAKAARIEAALDAFWEKWSEWQARQAAEAIDPDFGEADDDLDPDDPLDDDQDGEEAA